MKPRPRIIPKPTDEKELARVNFQCNEHNHNDSASVSSSTFLAPSATVPLSTSSSSDHEFSHYSPPNHSDEELTETPFEIKYIHQITCNKCNFNPLKSIGGYSIDFLLIKREVIA